MLKPKHGKRPLVGTVMKGYWVEETSDGGYIIVGTYTSYGSIGVDVWLIKTDDKGNQVWSKTFSGPSHDYGYSVQQTSDGGNIIAASTCPPGSDKEDFWLIKPMPMETRCGTGHLVATILTILGNAYEDRARSVQQTPDGSYIIAATKNTSYDPIDDAILIKTDSNGNNVWEKTFGGAGDDNVYCADQTQDGGFIIVGGTASLSAGSFDVWLIKTDHYGNVQ